MMSYANAKHHLQQMAFGLSVCLGVWLTGCQTLPKNPHPIVLPKQVSVSKTPSSSASNQPYLEQLTHSKLSGYYPIANGADAFAARSILSDKAQQSIDIQYYIWHNDEAGQLMLKDLWEAAGRGVKVRLLLDDMNGSQALDRVLIRFASHPNISVRLVNPFAYRKFRGVNFLNDARRLNARMHNKSMTFDGKVSIIGGRNIGNEYLNNTTINNFADLDVLLIGSVVGDVARSFEEYWQDDSAYDITTLVSPNTLRLDQLLKDVVFDDYLDSQIATKNERALRSYRLAMQNSTISTALLEKRLPFRWTNIQFLADPASKLRQPKYQPERHLVAQLRQKIGRPKNKLSIISSYFVPTKAGVTTLSTLANQGVKVSILTNSFDATDVGLVHSGYAHWRKTLLQSGVNLYEVKSTASNAAADENKFWRTKQTTSTSLHAKAFAVDDDQVFIGSYNFDPRSANINTELGVLIYDQLLATRLHDVLDDTPALMEQSYHLMLNDKGKIEWHTIENHQYKIYQHEPKTSLGDRANIVILSWLPLDWLL